MSRLALVSEHASPLAAIGRVDAGGQNVYVRCLAEALARIGHDVDVFTRRDDPQCPRRVAMSAGVDVVHVDAGPAQPIEQADVVVATCADELTELSALGASPNGVAVVPCGFDAVTFAPRGPALRRGSAVRLSAVSRMVPRKGLVEILEAVSLVPGAELVVAGGPAGGSGDAFLDQLRALAAALS